MIHYHMTRYPEDDNPPEIFPDIYSALGYAAEILRELADNRIDRVSYVAGEYANGATVHADEARSALQDFFESEKYDNLATNAATRAGNRLQATNDRPPLFADLSEPGNIADDNSPHSLLFQSAMWVKGQINEESPVSIWSCELETGEIDNPSSDDYGMMFCAGDL